MVKMFTYSAGLTVTGVRTLIDESAAVQVPIPARIK